MRLCSIGFSLCVFPVAGSPGFQSGGARLQACGKSTSTRRASAPALRPVAQPFLAVRLWTAGSPLTAFFATSGDEALWHRLQPVCLSWRWKPRISIRGSTPSGVRKKRSTRRPSESVWQLPFRVRARFQPCRNCCQINKASAAGGLPFQLPHRLFSTAFRSLSPPLFVFSPLVYPELRGATRLPCLP
jgi:hypothetical protein